MAEANLRCDSVTAVSWASAEAECSCSTQVNNVGTVDCQGDTDIEDAIAIGMDTEVCEHQPEPNEEENFVASPADLFAILREQQALCAACGKDLEPDDSELDHITPRADGGSDKKNNLQWLCLGCNRAKGSMNMQAFIALCRRVASWQATPSPGGQGTST